MESRRVVEGGGGGEGGGERDQETLVPLRIFGGFVNTNLPSILSSHLGGTPWMFSRAKCKEIADFIERETVKFWDSYKLDIVMRFKGQTFIGFDYNPTCSVMLLRACPQYRPRGSEKLDRDQMNFNGPCPDWAGWSRRKDYVYEGDVSMENVLRIAVHLRDVAKKSDALTFEGTVKEVLGTARNLGFTVDGGKNPLNLQRRIAKGTLQVSPDGVMPYVQWLHLYGEREELGRYSQPMPKLG